MLDGKRILIVEDNANDADLIRHVLINAHGIFEIASTLSEAEERVDSFHPIIVILDIGLPRSREDNRTVEFSEILSFIRSLKSKSAVVLLTGNVQIEHVEAAMSAGAMDYISKDMLTKREQFEPRIKEAYKLYLAIQTNQEMAEIHKTMNQLRANQDVMLGLQKISTMQQGRALDQKEDLLKKQMFEAGRKHEREIVRKRQLMAWGAFVASLWGFGKTIWDFVQGWNQHGK